MKFMGKAEEGAICDFCNTEDCTGALIFRYFSPRTKENYYLCTACGEAQVKKVRGTYQWKN